MTVNDFIDTIYNNNATLEEKMKAINELVKYRDQVIKLLSNVTFTIVDGIDMSNVVNHMLQAKSSIDKLLLNPKLNRATLLVENVS